MFTLIEELVGVVMGEANQIPQGVEAAWSVLPETPNIQEVGQLGAPILTKQNDHGQLACWEKKREQIWALSPPPTGSQCPN